MATVPWPSDEIARLAELHALGALETFPQPDFSALAELAAQTCQAPIALVNLIGENRQYFKGRVGTSATGMNRQMAFCPYVICVREVVEVPDAAADERFRDDPVVTGQPHARFYAGAPVVSATNHALGTVCVMDHSPRRLVPPQRRALEILAANAAALLQAQHQAEALEQFQKITSQESRLLHRITGDLRLPLVSLRAYLQLIEDGGLDEAMAANMLQTINRVSPSLSELIDELTLLARLNSQLTALARTGRTSAGNGHAATRPTPIR
ncbi:GAF domain-containing protein [Planomonospora sp. ID67723]|uniref:sensor histidine kinase n=1 Tax=Planomonospora sp. ID67723 TaxID=2738134 RepID=UPI0018C40C80|nr:GAF domain-containing protein [Planomonospora sp. ID67723]MBG0831451.1 GAF domain-containing protein [Planomonospora sp. ID67723]